MKLGDAYYDSKADPSQVRGAIADRPFSGTLISTSSRSMKYCEDWYAS